jgi:outer membrane protein TolC
LLPVVCAAVLLAACSTAPVPDAPPSEAFRGAGSGAVGGDTVDVRWWATFGDPVLAAWVNRALLNPGAQALPAELAGKTTFKEQHEE